MKKIITAILLCSIFLSGIAQAKRESGESMDRMWGEATVNVDALRAGRGKLFDQGNFAMFIHWGLFSHLGGVWNDTTYYGIGEWIMHPRMAGIPVDEYKKIAGEFNPSEFDAMAIARLAKDAGMKYIIITSKHHEGFAMFKSEASDFNIVDATPFGRDPMKELSEACEKMGLGFGFYYSHNQDWTSPGASGGPEVNPDGSPASFENYFYSKCKPQVKEICTNYGDLDFVWFDTPGSMPKEYVVELVDLVRELQPGAMLCSRVGHGMGDYASKGDMEVPPRNISGLWETCDTNNDSWSYAWYDNNFKSPKEILHRLIATVGRGGTYLFNVGPDKKGNIPEPGVHFLQEAGQWIRKYPQVVYGAGPSPWERALPWGDVTTRGNSLYLSVFEWPQDGKLYLPGLETEILSARIPGAGEDRSIPFRQDKEWTVLDLPYKPADIPVSVIELELAGNALQAAVDPTHGIHPNIETELLVEFAEVKALKKEKIRWMEKFGEWKHVTQVSNWTDDSFARWTVEVKQPGYYYLDLRYKGEDRLVWRTLTDEKVMVQNQQPATGKYQYYPMGIIKFSTAGEHTLTVSLVEGNPETSSLEAIRISPIR